MAITSTCGPHCGISGSREGHCDCGTCHDGTAPIVITRSDLLTVASRETMCDRWYERSGDYRPWQDHRVPALNGCMCGVSPHALPRSHGKHCAVRQYHDRMSQEKS